MRVYNNSKSEYLPLKKKICLLVALVMLFVFLIVAGWGLMVLGSEGVLLGHLPRLLRHLPAKGLGVYYGLEKVPSCQIIFPMLYWLCRM